VPVAPASGRPASTVRRSCFGAPRSCNASLSPLSPVAPLGSSMRESSLTPPLIS
jgi:hypothetical protein